jgi:hypothetical protein
VCVAVESLSSDSTVTAVEWYYLEAIPVTGRGGLYGCEMLRIPQYLDSRLADGCKVGSLTRQLLIYSPETLLFIILILVFVRD